MRTLGNSLSLRIALFLPPFPEAPGAGGGRERTQRQRKETERQSLKVNSVGAPNPSFSGQGGNWRRKRK